MHNIDDKTFLHPIHLKEFSIMINSIYPYHKEISGIFELFSYDDNLEYVDSGFKRILLFLKKNNGKTIIIKILECCFFPKHKEYKEQVNEILKEYDLYMNSSGKILESDNQECSIQIEESIQEIKVIDDAHID